MKREKQLIFERLNLKSSTAFGGALLKNSNPKTSRPISSKCTMHVVLRSSRCRGRFSLSESKNLRMTRQILKHQAQKHGIKIYRTANAYNHIHMILLPRSRLAFVRFIKATSGLIARKMLNAERGSAAKARFWDKRPWTRIISWGHEITTVMSYLEKNILEAMGFITYQPRATRFSSA